MLSGLSGQFPYGLFPYHCASYVFTEYNAGKVEFLAAPFHNSHCNQISHALSQKIYAKSYVTHIWSQISTTKKLLVPTFVKPLLILWCCLICERRLNHLVRTQVCVKLKLKFNNLSLFRLYWEIRFFSTNNNSDLCIKGQKWLRFPSSFRFLPSKWNLCRRLDLYDEQS